MESLVEQQNIKQKCFQFNIDKCVGCHACVVACSIENPSDQNIPWREISTFNPMGYPDIPLFHLSIACNHCENAPCMKNCPAMTYSKDLVTGAIVHFADKCIGCKYCTWACPYDAPKFNVKTKVIEKCTLCNSRIINGLKPACANLCPTGALDFIDKPTELSHQNLTGFTDIGIKPLIKIISPNKEKPKLVVSENQSIPKNIKNFKESSKITIKKEWPLIIFTFLAMIMVSVFSSNVIGNTKPNPLMFAIAGLAGICLSLLHLGRKIRAWRSILNLKNSWLSREIFFFGLFFVTSIIYFYINQHIMIGIIGVLFGVLTLISIDRVYELAQQATPAKIHSAHVLLSFFLFSALFSEVYKAFIFIALIKIVLYAYRKFQLRKQNKNYRLLLSGFRLDLILSFPLLFLLFDMNNIFWWVTSSILLGEIIDRVEYYDELDIITPSKQMELDLKKYN